MEKTEIEAADIVLSDYACDICGNVPDITGLLVHGRGCYTQSEDGGGEEWIDLHTKYQKQQPSE